MRLLLIKETSEIRGEISHGIGLIGTIAKELATVRIIDNDSLYVTHSPRKLMEKIVAFSPDIIGFHINTHNIYRTGFLVGMIKQKMPHICLIGGGIHAFYEPGEILDLGIHIVAVEEADLTINPLLNALRDFVGSNHPFRIHAPVISVLSQVPGLLFDDENKNRISTGRPNFITDLDQLPFIDHTLFNLEDYIHKSEDGHYVTNTLLTQRGCPFSCTFCQGDEQQGAFRMSRANSPQYQLNYIKHLHKMYNHKYFIFLDTNFTLNRKKTLEFCELIITSELHDKIKFYCETNAFAIIDEALATALRRAGCVDMALGIERLTEDSLRKINKKLKPEIIHACVRNISAVGIRLAANVLLGFPFDTEQTIQEEEKHFTQLLNHVDSISCSVVVPLPGTQIYQQTRHQKWYLKPEYIRWKPPFYHYAFNFNGNAWQANYFDLDQKTMRAILAMREKMHTLRIERINSRLVSFLFMFVKGLARISLFLFRMSPIMERIVFYPVLMIYNFMWKLMVSKFYVER
ncbi:MAG: radical SAM protein [Magnetococcus sp. YQC-5]